MGVGGGRKAAHLNLFETFWRHDNQQQGCTVLTYLHCLCCHFSLSLAARQHSCKAAQSGFSAKQDAHPSNLQRQSARPGEAEHYSLT